MDNFIPSENPSGVEQLKRSAVHDAPNAGKFLFARVGVTTN